LELKKIMNLTVKGSMKKQFIPFVFASILLLNLGCKKSLTEPVPDNTQPGRRDYVWTVDTLNYPYNTIYRIWGSSPTDVWAVSPGGALDKTIFHFDGTRWSTDEIYRSFSPSAVFGFASNDVWSGGGSGKIWRFDGSDWKEFIKLTKDGHSDIVFDNMWGESQNDIYAFGAYFDNNGLPNNSVIAHFVNNEWTMFNTDSIKGIVEHLYKDKNGEQIYMQVVNMGGGEHYDSTIIYEYSQGKYNKLYSSIWTRGLEADISLINNEVYFILGSRIAKRINNQFVTVLQVDNPNFYQRIWGRNDKDMFLFMTDGLVHYNGSDMIYLQHFDKPRTQIYGAALFEKEVFILVSEGQTNLNLIYHGVLK